MDKEEIVGKLQSIVDDIRSLPDPQRIESVNHLEWAIKFPQHRTLIAHLLDNQWEMLMWTENFPQDRRHFQDKITDVSVMVQWARLYPQDHELMLSRVKGDVAIDHWKMCFPKDKING